MSVTGNAALGLAVLVPNVGAQRGRFAPLVPGSDTSSTFDQSLVLTGRATGRALTVSQLSESDYVIAPDQMWQTVWGVLS